MVKTYFRKHIALLFVQIHDKYFKYRRIELISRKKTCTKGPIDNSQYDPKGGTHISNPKLFTYYSTEFMLSHLCLGLHKAKQEVSSLVKRWWWGFNQCLW